jgi:hypothetical protein
MPSISGPFGPIVEPGWIGGAEMPGQPDLVKSYLSAAQLSATNNAKTMQYEAQLAHYASMADEARKTGALREMQFSLDKQKSDLAQQDRIRGFQIAEERNQKIAEDKERDDKWRKQKYDDFMEAKDGLARAKGILSDEGLTRGMKGYSERYHQLTDDIVAKLPNQIFASEQKAEDDAHNRIATQKWGQFRQMEQSFNSDLRKTLYNDQFGGTSLLENPELLQPETQSTWSLRHPWAPDKPTGRLLVPQPSGGTLPVAASEVARITQSWKNLQNFKNNLAETTHNPEIGVFDYGKEPAPVDEAMREDNKVYLTPDGNQNRWVKPPGAVKGQWVTP